MRDSLFLLVGCALFCAAMAAAAQNFGDFTYATNGGSATITGYTGSGGAVVIPSAIYGLPVTAIGDRVFFSMPSVTGVTIPASVRSVGELAFDACGLTSLTIPNSVTNIGLGAFSDCVGLTNVTIPESVISIGLNAFRDCTNLITPPAIFSYTTVDGAVTVTDWDGSGSAVAFPSAINGLPVTAIGDSLGGPLWGGFYLPWVTNLTVANGVARIGDETFLAGAFTQVTIPASVTNLGKEVFQACPNVTAINVDGQNAFYASVNGVVFDKSRMALVQWPMGMVGSYRVPDGVVSIADGALEGSDFSGLGALVTSLTLPSSLTSIGAHAFDACYALTNVTIAGSLTNLGDYAFADCPSLKCFFFMGNAPSLFPLNAVAYGLPQRQAGRIWYLPGTTGWDRPLEVWVSLWDADVAGAAVQGGQLTLEITATGGIPVLVEATTNLAAAAWVPLRATPQAPNLYYVPDPQWTNYPARFYRVRPF